MQKETQHIEFKPSFNEDVIETLVAFANAKGGKVLVGWDAYPDALHSLDNISLDKVQNTIEIQKSNQMTINEAPLPFLLKNDLIREEKPVNAAFLMFKNRDSIDTTIELGRFKTPITILDSARTQTDIITQVNQVMDFVRKHINVEIIITGKPQNTQKWHIQWKPFAKLSSI